MLLVLLVLLLVLLVLVLLVLLLVVVVLLLMLLVVLLLLVPRVLLLVLVLVVLLWCLMVHSHFSDTLQCAESGQTHKGIPHISRWEKITKSVGHTVFFTLMISVNQFDSSEVHELIHRIDRLVVSVSLSLCRMVMFLKLFVVP